MDFNLILADWTVMLIPEISDPRYQVNVTIIRNIHNHHHYLPNNWTGAKIFVTGCLCYHSLS